MTPSDREYSVSMTPEQWHERLSPQEFAVLREAGTERPFTGEYTDSKSVGVYACRACGAEALPFAEQVRFALRVAVLLLAAG